MAIRTSDRYTLAVMGRAGVGKSAITLRYTRNRFVEDYDPTIEDLHLKHATVAGTPACLEILDTAGQETYSALRRSWMQKACGFLFIFSLIDRQTFDELSTFQDELMDLFDDDPPPSVLVANKSDIDRSEWRVQDEEVRLLKESWKNCQEVVYTSAKTNKNIADAFERLCLSVRERAARIEQKETARSTQRAAEAEAAGGKCFLQQCVQSCTIQ